MPLRGTPGAQRSITAVGNVNLVIYTSAVPNVDETSYVTKFTTGPGVEQWDITGVRLFVPV